MVKWPVRKRAGHSCFKRGLGSVTHVIVLKAGTKLRGGAESSGAAAADAFKFVLVHFPAQRVAVNSELFSCAGLVSVGALQHAADEFLFKFRDRFLEQNSTLDHHSDQRFELVFHDCTLRRTFSEKEPFPETNRVPYR